MYEIIIATHGKMAEGMFDSARMFTAQLTHIHTLVLDESGIYAFEEKVDQLIEKLKECDVLVLTDIAYATPFNTFVKKVTQFKNQVEILAGVNMPALLEALIQQENLSLAEVAPLVAKNIQAISFKDIVQQAEISEEDE